jgi:predicted MPP superfamily phosphohydrolase
LNVATFVRLLMLLLLLVCHIGFWIWLFNRTNALGLERTTIKRIERLLIATCLVMPFLFFAWEWRMGDWGSSFQDAWQRFHSSSFLKHLSVVTLVYFGFVLLFAAIVGPRWVSHRPQFAVAKDRYQLGGQSLRKNLHLDNPDWITGRLTQHFLRLPGNEILSLETNIKRLRLEGIAPSFLGLRIGHLSDIHLMGQVAPDFTRYSVDWVLDQGVEFLVVSGDLVDDAKAIPMLERALGGLNRSLPKVFVLGNHDKAHGLVVEARDAMVSMGWLDAGASHWIERSHRGCTLILGNERPWLERHNTPHSHAEATADQEIGLVLGVSHSPDQFAWGRAMGCHLLLCGHTHGGQVRFPGIGPIVAPSWYGSRFASGVFYGAPTVMHVSRGLSGTHPLRWRCAPEASVLEVVSQLEP